MSQSTNVRAESDLSLSGDGESSEIPLIRKRRKIAAKSNVISCRVWSPEMLSRVPWASRFFSGPKEPGDNPYSAYCHICSINISVWSKGHHDIVRHWKRERHFRREQLYRDSHGMDVLDRERNVLTGRKLEVEREIFSTAKVVELGPRYPYIGESPSREDEPVEVVPLQMKIQLQSLLELIRNGDPLSSFQSVWKVVTAHLPRDEITSDLDFSNVRVIGLTQFLFHCMVKSLSESIGGGRSVWHIL